MHVRDLGDLPDRITGNERRKIVNHLLMVTGRPSYSRSLLYNDHLGNGKTDCPTRTEKGFIHFKITWTFCAVVLDMKSVKKKVHPDLQQAREPQQRVHSSEIVKYLHGKQTDDVHL